MLQHIAAYLCKVEDEVKVHNLKQIMMPLGMRDKGNQAKQVPGTVRSTQEQVPLSVLLHTAAWFCIDWFVVIERNIYQIFRTRMHLLLLTVVVLFATLARRCSATPMHGKWDVISCQVSEELHCHQAAKIINWSWVEQLSLVILVRIASGGMDYVFDMFRGDDVMRHSNCHACSSAIPGSAARMVFGRLLRLVACYVGNWRLDMQSRRLCNILYWTRSSSCTGAEAGRRIRRETAWLKSISKASLVFMEICQSCDSSILQH